MILELARLRAETPGVSHRVHLNNAGAALMPAPVVDAMVSYIGREAEIGGYEAAYESTARLDAVYGSVARLIGAAPDEIALTENATVAWQMAFYSMAFGPGDRILTAQAEYAANYVAFLQTAKRTGAVIDVVPNSPSGQLDPDALERMIDGRVRLIAVTWVPTNSGLVNPAHAIGRIARAHGIPFLLDACQAVGQMAVDVEELGCDMLSATGRKFLRAPRGTGFLYIRRALMLTLEPPMIDHFGASWVTPDRYELRNDARRFETWDNNYAARLGLGVAADYAMRIGIDDIEARCVELAAALRSKLANTPGVVLHEPAASRAAIVSFTLAGQEARIVNRRLYDAGVNISTSPPSSTLIDSVARGLPPLLRASPHYYNTVAELDLLVEAVRATH